MRSAVLSVVLGWAVCASAAAAGFFEGAAVEERFEFPVLGSVRISGQFLEVDVAGGEAAAVRGKVVLSSRLRERNGARLAVHQDAAELRLSIDLNGLPVGRASVAWGPRLAVVVPSGVALTVETTVGDVRVQGLAGGLVRVRTAAGDVWIGDGSMELEVFAGSGSVVVERTAGAKSIATTTGSVTIVHSSGAARVATVSGRQEFRDITGDLTVTSSADLKVRDHRGALVVEPSR